MIRGKVLFWPWLIANCFELIAADGLAFAFLVFGGDEQFEAHQPAALVAYREALPRLEAGFMGKAVLDVRNLIDPGRRDHFARFVNFLGGIGIHALCRVA